MLSSTLWIIQKNLFGSINNFCTRSLIEFGLARNQHSIKQPPTPTKSHCPIPCMTKAPPPASREGHLLPVAGTCLCHPLHTDRQLPCEVPQPWHRWPARIGRQQLLPWRFWAPHWQARAAGSACFWADGGRWHDAQEPSPLKGYGVGEEGPSCLLLKNVDSRWPLSSGLFCRLLTGKVLMVAALRWLVGSFGRGELCTCVLCSTWARHALEGEAVNPISPSLPPTPLSPFLSSFIYLTVHLAIAILCTPTWE